MSQANRVETMAVKLAAYTRRAHVDPRSIVRAYEIAVAHRLRVLNDVFHRDLLHPARTVLILLEDAGCTDPRVLSASAITETEFPQLRLSASELDTFDPHVVQLSMSVPLPATSDTLLEDLLGEPEAVALIALAERLDHARHLHFRDPAIWPPFFTQIVDCYLPFAGRMSEPLARRFARWCKAFETRFLRAT